MRDPRHGGLARRGRSEESSDPQAEAIQATRTEAKELARRARLRRRAERAENIQMRVKGGALEAKRRLKPVGRGLRAFLGRIAPPITAALLAVLRLPVLVVIGVLDLATRALAWLRPRLAALGSAIGALVVRWVTPINTAVFIGLVAAVTLGASQFMDYRGVAVGADHYSGEVGTVAPAPLTDVERTGSAHLYLLLPIAVAAFVLTVLSALRRPDLARYLLGLGLLCVVVSLAVDLPQGLEAGTEGSAYASSDVELLDGFWIQLFSGLVIALAGYLLGRERRDQPAPPAAPSGESRWPRRLAGRRRDETAQAPGPGGGPPPWEAGA